MQIKQETLLQFHNISLKYENRDILNSVSGSILYQDRIGLIGINGSGKSSLLKILAGKIQGSVGSVQSNVRVEYLPQLDLEVYRTDIALYKYLEKETFQWWDVLSTYEELFHDSINEFQSLVTLSGGELAKIHLSLVIAQNPDLILLDEPTNHLDLESLKELEKILLSLKIPYILVSHNIDFLDKTVNKIWELENSEIKIFSGNYDFYKEQKKQILEAKKRMFTTKKKQISKLDQSLDREQKRAQRSKRTGRKFAKFGGTDKFAQTYFKDRSEKSAGGNEYSLNKKKAKLMKELDQYNIDESKKAYVNFYTKSKNGLILRIKNGSLSIGNSKALLNSITFKLYHGDRIALLGNNGSGKTIFAKQLEYKKKSLLKGEIKYGDEYKILYIDQKYDIIHHEITVIENIQTNNRKINYENARKVLGNLSFPMDYDINKIAGDLSGGETARLAFAIATSSEVDLLVLDEPTNNLDIETVEVIATALKEFRGTILIISHDIAFLKKINIENVYEIKDKSLIKLDFSEFNSKLKEHV